MDNITEEMMQQLMSAGFSFPDYAHHLNFGMCYAWNGSTYRIGGREDGAFTELDKRVAAEGLWLPDGSQLLEWLKACRFTVSVQLDADGYYHAVAADTTSCRQYTGGGPLLSHALHKLIYKICKSCGQFRPTPILRLRIAAED